MRRGILLLTSGALLVMMGGCSLGHHCQSSCASCPPRVDEMPPPAVLRTAQESSIRDLAASVLPPQTLDEPFPPEAYRAVAPMMCQCLSAKHAPTADGFDSKRRQLEEEQANSSCRQGHKFEKQAKQRAFQESMLLYSALESRDQAAGVALEWYFQLAGAEAKADLLNDSLEQGRNSLRRIEELRNLGIPLPAPIEEYQRQIVELKLQQGQNQLTIEQLNTKLRLAMGYDSRHVWRIWPDPGMPLGTPSATLVPLVPDVEAAVQLGLHQRPQLLLLRNMIANLDADTLGSARVLLQSINPLLAMSSPGPSCKLLKLLGKILHIEPGQDDELERVRTQLCDLLHERERTVEAEIREAAHEIGARRETILRARQAAESWQERIRDLEKQQAEGLKGALSLASAYLDWYKARGEVVKEFLGWKIAAVKLKQAQGILPAECGYAECHSQ
ncbi:MAG TPA: hypothetical protein VH592_20970 [Gemmataceae bacterium]|jgi:hypothetical protein